MPTPKQPLLSDRPKYGENSPISRIRPLLAALLVLSSSPESKAQHENLAAIEFTPEELQEDGGDAQLSDYDAEFSRRALERYGTWPNMDGINQIMREMRDDGWEKGRKVDKVRRKGAVKSDLKVSPPLVAPDPRPVVVASGPPSVGKVARPMTWFEELENELRTNWANEMLALYCGLMCAFVAWLTGHQGKKDYKRLWNEYQAMARGYREARDVMQEALDELERVKEDCERENDIKMHLFYAELEETRYALTRKVLEEPNDVREARDALDIDRDTHIQEIRRRSGVGRY